MPLLPHPGSTRRFCCRYYLILTATAAVTAAIASSWQHPPLLLPLLPHPDRAAAANANSLSLSTSSVASTASLVLLPPLLHLSAGH